MRRCRAGTVSKAQRRAVVLGTSASTAEASQVLYCSGGRRIPSLRDGEVLVLPGRHTNPSEMPLFLKDGPAVDLMGSGGRECYGREASASTNSIPTSMGWAGHSCTSHSFAKRHKPLGEAVGPTSWCPPALGQGSRPPPPARNQKCPTIQPPRWAKAAVFSSL